MSFVSEIKRRNVFKVAIAYAAVSWLLIQVSTSIEEPLGLPGWFDTLVIVFLGVAFPIALVLAWAFELTPEGIKPTARVERGGGFKRKTSRRLNFIVIAALAVAVTMLAVDKYISEDFDVDVTLAVLAFTSDPGQQYFAIGFSEELANTLDEVQSLSVKGTPTSLQRTDLGDKELGEILGAEYLLSGNIVSSGSGMRVQAQLIRADSGVRLWSDAYDRAIAADELFMMMDELVEKVADALQVRLGVGIGDRLGMTRNVNAYDAYVRAISLNASPPFSIPDAIDSIDAAIRYDERFALAWATKAELHYYQAVLFSGGRAQTEREASLAAARRAIEIEPEMAEARAIRAEQSARQGDWRTAEIEFEEAYGSSPAPSIARKFSRLQLSVGKFDESYELLRAALGVDALNRSARADLVLTLGYLGRLPEANDEYETSLQLFASQDFNYFEHWNITLSRLGSGDSATSTEPIEFLNAADGIYQSGLRHRDSPDEGIEEIKILYSQLEDPSMASRITAAVWSAYLGDTDFVLDLLERIARLDAQNIYIAWAPAMKGVRQTQRFRQLLREIGLVDYWEEYGWPAVCNPLNDEFTCG